MGSFGMSSSVTNPAGYYSIEGTAPFCGTPDMRPSTSAHRALSIAAPFPPSVLRGTAPTTVTYPFRYPRNNFAITWGLDSKIKTPYSETFDLSVQRELPGGFIVRSHYVGRLGRHLLQQLDLAEPVDYVDPAGRR